MSNFRERTFELGGGLVSGSRCNKILTQPLTQFYLVKGLLKKIEPGHNPTWPRERNEWIQQKLFWGTELEDIILKASSKWNPKYGEIKFDKRSFELEFNPKFTGNIDGYIGQDINNIDIIVENKLTQSNDKIPNQMDVLEYINRYEDQVRYYMWFFNAQKGLLNLLFNGCVLKQHMFERDFLWDMNFLDKAEKFMKAIETNNISLIDWSTIEQELKKPFNEIATWLQVEKRGKIRREDWQYGIIL